MNDRLTGKEINQRLTDRLEALLHELLPRGEVWQHEYVALNPMRADGNLGSFRIHISGAKRGVWADFALPGVRGDALDLVAYLGFEGDKGAAMRWARRWLGIAHDPPPLKKGVAPRAGGNRDPETNYKAARDIWKETRPLAGTLADRYLLGRGIDIRRLAHQPASLAFHPGVRHAETGRYHPCLVAIITRPDHKFAIHRIYLQQQGDAVTKLRGVKAAKMTLGGVGGGQVRLARGRAGTKWTESQATETIALTEGIEDALCVAQEVPEWRVASVVSMGNFAATCLPPGHVVIVADNDSNESAVAAGDVVLDRAARRFRAEGRRVRIARMPAGFKDANEFLLKGRSRAPEVVG